LIQSTITFVDIKIASVRENSWL